MSEGARIEFDGVHFAYGRTQVLSDFSDHSDEDQSPQLHPDHTLGPKPSKRCLTARSIHRNLRQHHRPPTLA